MEEVDVDGSPLRPGEQSFSPLADVSDDKLMTTVSSWGETTLPIPDDENDIKLQEAIDNLTKRGVQQVRLRMFSF